MDFQNIKDVLQKNNFKITKQREYILDVLITNQHTLLSAETILNSVREKFPSINLTTIYRNLDQLTLLGVLAMFATDDGIARYKLTCADHHHHHIICQHCGKVKMIDYCPLETLSALALEQGFHLSDHKIELYGLCDECYTR
ncbi:Fur family transcriptional regulator [Vallitaleaceae bacterium 9-2]